MKLTTTENSLVVKGNVLKLRSCKPQGNMAKKEKLTMDHAVNTERERGPEEEFPYPNTLQVSVNTTVFENQQHDEKASGPVSLHGLIPESHP